MEWLIAHEDELSQAPAGSGLTNNNKAATASAAASDKQPQSPATGKDASINQGDDFRPEETAVEAAARKKITVEEAQRLITERAAIRAEEERKKAIEDEKKRRLDGQKMIQTRAELQDLERIRLAQQIRQEKLEKEQHRKRLLEQIALDRENMKNKFKPAEPKAATTSSSISSSSTTTTTRTTTPSNCKVALRFPDGSTQIQEFNPQEQLCSIRLFCQMQKNLSPQADVEFIAPPNKKLTEANMQETLVGLGLCPASRLEVKYKKSDFIALD